MKSENTRLNVKIPKDVKKSIKIHCVENGLSIKDFTIEVFKTYIRDKANL